MKADEVSVDTQDGHIQRSISSASVKNT